MPHLIIEHSANVTDTTDLANLVDTLHGAALSSGVAPLDALRTRTAERTHYAIADRHPDNAFIAVTIRLGEGRTAEQKRDLVELLMDALGHAVGEAQRNMMLSVECQEIESEFRINKNNLRQVIAERTATTRPHHLTVLPEDIATSTRRRENHVR